MKKKIWLPKFILRRIDLGKEEDELCSISVPIFLYVVMGLAFLWYQFFDKKYWIFWVGGTLLVVFLSLFTYYKFAIQIDVLAESRKRLKISYDNAKTSEEKDKIRKELLALQVYLDD